MAWRNAYGQSCDSASDFAFELFCRALDEHDQHAWLVIQEIYMPLVKSWIGKSISGISEFDADDCMQMAYTKFWRSLSRDDVSVRDKFPHIGSVLKYLHQCVVTTSVDQVRKKQRLARLDERLLKERKKSAFFQMTFQESCEKMERVRLWMQSKVDDPSERLLLKLLYEYDLKPAQIVQTFPEEFPDHHHVRRVRDRVMKRARRALV